MNQENFNIMNDDFYLIGGNNQQIKEYCRVKDLKYNPNHIFHNPDCLRGKKFGIKVILIGSYYLRPDWSEFVDMLTTRNCIIEYDYY